MQKLIGRLARGGADWHHKARLQGPAPRAACTCESVTKIHRVNGSGGLCLNEQGRASNAVSRLQLIQGQTDGGFVVVLWLARRVHGGEPCHHSLHNQIFRRGLFPGGAVDDARHGAGHLRLRQREGVCDGSSAVYYHSSAGACGHVTFQPQLGQQQCLVALVTRQRLAASLLRSRTTS